MLAAAYDFLRETPPYRAWKLPPSSALRFRVARDRTVHGWFEPKKSGLWIAVSTAGAGHTDTVLRVVAHEMIHLHQHITGAEGRVDHNEQFKRLAQRVCKLHGWDYTTFFL